MIPFLTVVDLQMPFGVAKGIFLSSSLKHPTKLSSIINFGEMLTHG
jgi:hypothetical protein